jgi:DNA primase catalytic core
MARITEAEIERIKREIDLAELVTSAGVELRAHGDNLIGRCVFHAPDNNPSLVVTKSKNLFHCLGCGVAGSVIDWIMKRERVSFRHAIEILRSHSSLAASSLAAEVTSRNKPAINLSADDETLLNETVAYYCNHIGEARPYLASRGLDDEEMISHFHLGFSNRSLGYHLPDKQLKAGKEARARLIEIGLLRESGHEHFAGSLIIPIFDELGNVVEIYGRKVTPKLRAGTPLHLYLKGKHKGVWNWQCIAQAKEIILCEALIDGLTIWRAGYRNVTACYGVNGLTEEMLATFTSYGVEKVIIAFDNDEAGNRGVESAATKLLELGIDCYRLKLPIGMDVNEYALTVSNPAEAIGQAIRSAEWIANGKRAADIISAVENNADNEQQEISMMDDADYDHAPAQAPAKPAAQLSNSQHEIKGEDIHFQFGERSYRVRGLYKNLSCDSLKVNILASYQEHYHIDTFDLYSARARNLFISQVGDELAIKAEVIKTDVGKLLLELEQLQEEHIAKTLAPKEQAIKLTEEERAAALAFLKDPQLIKRIVKDFADCGVVGEETNLLMGYLGTVSRLLDRPLGILIQSSSAAGKTSLMDAVLLMIPKEGQVKYSAMTGQSIFYLGEVDLRHKVLAIAEEEGARRASYALKLLQSEGEVSIASTGKDPISGKLVTHEYEVIGPVMLFSTTTAVDIDEELLNRCIILTVNEDREQTRAIHKQQRQQYTLAGLWAKDKKDALRRLHRNAHRLLKPLEVVNHYANELTFLDSKTRTRRDHEKYLTLINAIALLHQYQRPIKTDTQQRQSKQYIEVTIDDIEIANELANEVLGRSLDELPPQTRRLLIMIDEMVKAVCEKEAMARETYRFTRRQIREHTGWHDTQLRMHMERLVELEYLLVHRGTRGQQFVYELLYDGKGRDGELFIVGLLDVEELRKREAITMTQSSRG